METIALIAFILALPIAIIGLLVTFKWLVKPGYTEIDIPKSRNECEHKDFKPLNYTEDE